MIRLGQTILQSRRYAGLVALGCGLLLALGWSIVAWFGLVIIALVTLRHGAKEGAFILAWYVLPEICYMIIQQVPWVFGYDVIMASGLWLLAVGLRQSRDWGRLLQITFCLGFGAVLAFHLLVPDLVMWWQAQLTAFFELMAEQSPSYDPENYQRAIQMAAQTATGSAIATVSAMLLFLLFLARWWQAALFNKGGLRQEMFALRLPNWLGGLLVLMTIGVMADYSIANDLLPVVMLPFVIKGLMLSHFLSAPYQAQKVILIVMYTILLIFSPYTVIILALFGLVDNWLDFRKKVTQLS